MKSGARYDDHLPYRAPLMAKWANCPRNLEHSMMLVEETTVPQAALPVDLFKNHLRMGSGFSDDAVQDPVLEAYLRAALAAVEARTGKITISRSFSLTVSTWREPDTHPLPVAPVSEIVSIEVISSDGTITFVDEASYVLRQDTDRPLISAVGSMLSSIPKDGKAKITATVGFGPDWADLPADLAHAIMMLAAHFYEHRHDTSGARQTMPFGVASLLDRFRPVRLFGGIRA